MSLRETVWITIGSVIGVVERLSLGFYAFQGRLLRVISGFGLFVTGYRIMQYGTYGCHDNNFITVQDGSYRHGLRELKLAILSLKLPLSTTTTIMTTAVTNR